MPQGSILGPLLFTLYINDLPGATTHSKVVLYADDTALFVSGDNVEDIQRRLNEDLKATSLWLYNNKLTLNAKKTKCMLFGSIPRLANITDPLQITVDSTVLEHVTNFKYLGLWFDPFLNWKFHTDSLCKKVAQRIGVITRIRKFISMDTAGMLAKTLVIPMYGYGDIIWSKGPAMNLDRVQKLQNRAARIVLRCGRRTSIIKMHATLGWLTCSDSFKLHKCLMVGKCLYTRVPSYLRGKFTRLRDVHSHGTRRVTTDLYAPCVKTTAAMKMFSYEGALLFNNLSSHVKESVNFRSFRSKCIQYFREDLKQHRSLPL